MLSCERCKTKLPEGKTKCRSCGHWNTGGEKKDTFHTLDKINPKNIKRFQSGPWDKCWGENYADKQAGMSATSVTLLAGNPGAGKSTILLQIADAYAAQGIEVIYIGTEEPEEQIKERADRLGIVHQNKIHMIDALTNPDVDFDIVTKKKALLLLDSVNGLVSDDLRYAVKVCKNIKGIAARNGYPAIVTSHITKEGDIAGLEALQHEVDTIMTFFTVSEGSAERELTVRKNRNGKTCAMPFIMTEHGLRAHASEES